MTKLIIQIPCFNEEKTLPITINDLPQKIEGIAEIEILVIDDGSTDRTVAIAKELGVQHIVYNKCNKGLARSFFAGLDAALKLGADIIVNTDGDNQYCGGDIPKLISPIMQGIADIVVGDREPGKLKDISPNKKILTNIGNSVVRLLSETKVPDAVSGFRAFSRKAAMQMNIVSPFSYTIETVIQAGKKHLAVESIPVKTNPKTRESRLFNSVTEFILQSMATMVRMYTMYQPLRVFFYIGVLLILIGLVPSVRFLIYYAIGQGDGHVQSLIFGAIFFIVGFHVLMIGLLADVISFNRRLIEDTLLRIKNIEMEIFDKNMKK